MMDSMHFEVLRHLIKKNLLFFKKRKLLSGSLNTRKIEETLPTYVLIGNILVLPFLVGEEKGRGRGGRLRLFRSSSYTILKL